MPDKAGGKKVGVKGVPSEKGQIPDSESDLSYSEEGTTSDEPSEGVEGFLPEGDESLPWRKPRRTVKTAPWRQGSRGRDRSLDSQLEKQPKWKKQSRDRSLDTKQLETQKKVIPWTQESVKLKKSLSVKKEIFEIDAVEETKLKTAQKLSKDVLKKERKLSEDLTLENKVKPWTEEEVQLRKVSVDKRHIEKEKVEEVHLKPTRKLSKDIGEKGRKPSIDSPLDKTVTPWTQEEIKLRKISVDKKQLDKEKFEDVQLKPLHKRPKDIETPERKYSLENINMSSEKKVAPWTEEAGKLKKVSIDKKQLEREKLEEVVLKPARKSSSATIDDLGKGPLTDLSFPEKKVVPWTEEGLKLKKLSLDKNVFEEEKIECITKQPDENKEDQSKPISSDESTLRSQTEDNIKKTLKAQQAIKLRRAKQHIENVLKTAVQKDIGGDELIQETEESKISKIKSNDYFENKISESNKSDLKHPDSNIQ